MLPSLSSAVLLKLPTMSCAPVIASGANLFNIFITEEVEFGGLKFIIQGIFLSHLQKQVWEVAFKGLLSPSQDLVT